MSCIVAISRDGVVYMAGDSQVTIRDARRTCERKVFKIGEIVMGFTGYPDQIWDVVYKMVLPQVGDDVHRWAVTELVPAMRALGWGKKESCVLVGARGKIVVVPWDGSPTLIATNYMSIGCGEDYALGAMHCSSKQRNSPQTILTHGLEAAADLCTGVCAPFVFVNT